MTRRTRIASLLFAAAIVGCGSDTTTPATSSVVAGLSETPRGDTVHSTSPVPAGPGYFWGHVLGPSQPGAGNDSLSTAPRIAGVVVTIYPRIAGTGTDVQTGPVAGSVTTGADGKFTLPTLPAGEYVVTFVPPANSGYMGAYAFGPLNANSYLYQWWVVLPKK